MHYITEYEYTNFIFSFLDHFLWEDFTFRYKKKNDFGKSCLDVSEQCDEIKKEI